MGVHIQSFPGNKLSSINVILSLPLFCQTDFLECVSGLCNCMRRNGRELAYWGRSDGALVKRWLCSVQGGFPSYISLEASTQVAL